MQLLPPSISRTSSSFPGEMLNLPIFSSATWQMHPSASYKNLYSDTLLSLNLTFGSFFLTKTIISSTGLVAVLITPFCSPPSLWWCKPNKPQETCMLIFNWKRERLPGQHHIIEPTGQQQLDITLQWGSVLNYLPPFLPPAALVSRGPVLGKMFSIPLSSPKGTS